MAIFETYNSETSDSDKLFVVDIEARKVILDFSRPCIFNSIVIDAAHSEIQLLDRTKFIFKMDYSGRQTNTDEYAQRIWKHGSVIQKFGFMLASQKKPEGRMRSTDCSCSRHSMMLKLAG